MANTAADVGERDSAQERDEHEQWQGGQHQGDNGQQAGQQLAQHQFDVREPGEQQQVQGAAIFFGRDGTGRDQGGKEQAHGQLQRRQQLKRSGAEAGKVAGAARGASAGDHLPGGT